MEYVPLSPDEEVSLRSFHQRGGRILVYLDNEISEIRRLSKSTATFRIWGSRVGMLGAIAMAGSVALIPFTGGASAGVVALIGTGVSSLGKVANEGSNAYEIRKENSKADEISANLRDLVRHSEQLIRILQEKEAKARKFDVSLLLNLIPLGIAGAGASGAATIAYTNTNGETADVFGYKIKTSLVAKLGAFVTIIGAIAVFLENMNIHMLNKRIVDGRTTTQFIEQLVVLRDALAKILTEAQPIPVQEQSAD